MFKIIILILLALIIYFFVRTRKGMSKIDTIYNKDDVEKIKAQLKTVEKLARKRGRAVAIGHPRDATLKALEGWLSSIAAKGFQLVPISALVRVARRKS